MKRLVANLALAALTLGTGSALAQRGTAFSEQDFEVVFSFFSVTKDGLLDLLMPGGQPAAPTAIAGQVGAGSIEGKVIRADNTPVAGAEVKLRRMAGDDVDETFEERTARTAEDGKFAFRALEAGTYALSITTKYADERMLPCKPSGLLARNRNSWLMAVARTADGGIVQVVTSDRLTVEGGQTRNETVDLRCRTSDAVVGQPKEAHE